MSHFNKPTSNSDTNWFDSPYYHLLYKHRSNEEAQLFIDKLVKAVAIPKDAKILDAGCGKGRHSIYLNQLGYDVTGIDLSPSSIAYASLFSNATLRFQVHDMKLPFKANYFDYVFNLFTSFGYFDHSDENVAVLKSMYQNLKTKGHLLIDFMNIHTINLVKEEEKSIEGIHFYIKRYIHNQFIIKEINVIHQAKEYTYKEQVQLLALKDFEKYFGLTGFKIVNLYGDYQMANFVPEQSPRLLMLAQKI